MKHFIASAWLLAALLPANAYAQSVDRSKYPDYSTDYRPDYSLLRPSQDGTRRTKAVDQTPLPDHVDNSTLRFFPPVFNQHGGSCGSASRICYMFTHELNAYRNLDAKSLANRYPSHFVWLLTFGNSNKDAFVENVGVPSAELYGGTTYSDIFGPQDAGHKDFGWMQGYDKWYAAMFNRMERPAHIPAHLGTDEGREILKRWLYNHNGDKSFHGGGIAGIGVASRGDFQPLPASPQNDAYGFTGKYYVKRWGTSVDHAMTIVGYDDRIEFDLNGNGIMGETSADERGAWIVVNSWGKGWCNQGFVYCPYAYAGASFTQNGDKYTFSGNWWAPEIYKVRKDYRPLRTIKLKMDYSHRSELHLSAGVSADLNATYPDKLVAFDHFKYAGDGKDGTMKPAPAVPMLGKWADGRLHDEPMEFGYDLTDLSAGFDKNQPLKYFFVIDTRDWGVGSGTIHNASIMDYENDPKGIETPFALTGGKMKIESKGHQTVISTIVYGRGLYAPQNLSLHEGTLSWQAPMRSHYKVEGYRVFANGSLLAEVGATQTNYTLSAEEANATYSVTAVYAGGEESAKVSVTTPVKSSVVNQVINLRHSGFSVPDIFRSKLEEATIEYWINPTSVASWNQSAGPGWQQFMLHANGNGAFTAGWDTGAHRVETAAGKLRVGQWTHIAITVKKNVLTVYINGVNSGTVTSDRYSGLGGFGNLTWRANDSSDDNFCKMDELRIWNYARSAEQIKANKGVQYDGKILPKGLLAYYKGETFDADGKRYLREYIDGRHAETLNLLANQTPNPSHKLTAPTDPLKATIVRPTTKVYAGIPVTLTAQLSESVNDLSWTAEGANIRQLHTTQPTLTFTQEGQQTVTLKASNAAGDSVIDTYTVEVAPTPAGDASFTPVRQLISAGEHITFLVNRPLLGYTYEWHMPGADVETARTINAAATYQKKGTYTVTLVVTAPNGKQTRASKQIQVTEVAPIAAFAIAPAVIIKGETTFLKDQSKYAPTAWKWTLSSPKFTYFINGGNSSFSPKHTGVYDATLTVTNGMGTHTLTQARALTVCNADSKNGLNFTEPTARVVLSKVPFTAQPKTFTLDWWMNPAKLSTHSCGLGDERTWAFKADQNGNFTLMKAGKPLCTAKEFIRENEWHHYAVAFHQGTVVFYRDGENFSQASLTETTLPRPNTFSIGLEEAPLLGMIDEFRVWNTALPLAKVKEYANQPLTEGTISPADELLVYYDFNQSSGNVKDRSGKNNDGRRVNFGPEGDAWGLSKGVFCLNLEAGGQTEDVTTAYLKNCKAPFENDRGNLVNPQGQGRFRSLVNWTLENAASNGGRIKTTAHVDATKNFCFTVTTGWDAFNYTLNNHKAYQTVTLPAGLYTFRATYDDVYEGDCGESYLVIARGKGLPDTRNVKEALSSKRMLPKVDTKVNEVEFFLDQPTEVSIGMVINMSGMACLTINRFELIRRGTENLEADGANGYDLVVGLDGLKTLALPYPTLVPQGVKAFAATEVKNGKVQLDEIADGIIPARTGVVIEAEAGEYHFEPSVEAGQATSLLLGVTDLTQTDDALKYYELQAAPTKGFTLFSGSTLEKNRAYLTRPLAETATFFPFNLIPTSIDGITTASPTAPLYDLSGRRVVAPAQGVYITKGKKVWVK